MEKRETQTNPRSNPVLIRRRKVIQDGLEGTTIEPGEISTKKSIKRSKKEKFFK